MVLLFYISSKKDFSEYGNQTSIVTCNYEINIFDLLNGSKNHCIHEHYAIHWHIPVNFLKQITPFYLIQSDSYKYTSLFAYFFVNTLYWKYQIAML